MLSRRLSLFFTFVVDDLVFFGQVVGGSAFGAVAEVKSAGQYEYHDDDHGQDVAQVFVDFLRQLYLCVEPFLFLEFAFLLHPYDRIGHLFFGEVVEQA